MFYRFFSNNDPRRLTLDVKGGTINPLSEKKEQFLDFKKFVKTLT